MRLKSLIKPKYKILLNVKMTKEQRFQIQQKADLYAGGNVSDWIRYASMNFDPKKEEVLAYQEEGDE